jgi:protein dithiol:quinone oxidoreductase
MGRWIATHRRLANLFAGLVAFALVGYALFTQHHQGLEPCPLCIFQRVGVIALGVGFLLAAALPTGSRLWTVLALALTLLPAFATAGIAARHLYIQAQPAGSVPACGATLDYMLDVFPLADVLRKVLTGSGECAKLDWTFLGISMPGWVLVWTLAFAAWALYVNLARRNLK